LQKDMIRAIIETHIAARDVELPLHQTTEFLRKNAKIEDLVVVTLSSFTRDGETAFCTRGRGFQGLAVVAPTETQAKSEAREVLAALRRARGQNNPYRVEFVRS
jgi:hypothetical protein